MTATTVMQRTWAAVVIVFFLIVTIVYSMDVNMGNKYNLWFQIGACQCTVCVKKVRSKGGNNGTNVGNVWNQRGRCVCAQCVKKHQVTDHGQVNRCNCIECNSNRYGKVNIYGTQKDHEGYSVLVKNGKKGYDKYPVLDTQKDQKGSGDKQGVGKNPPSDHGQSGRCNCKKCKESVGKKQRFGNYSMSDHGHTGRCNCIRCNVKLCNKQNGKESVGMSTTLANAKTGSVVRNTGGFNVIDEDRSKWVNNIVEERADSPRSSLVDFYVNAHTIVQRTGVPNYMSAKIPIPSKFNIDKWENLLCGYEDYTIVEFLKYGFPMGYSASRLPSSELKNHKGATGFKEFIDTYLEKEVDRGLILGPLGGNPLTLPLSVSPLNSVPKKEANERRVICDLSYPKGSSVNDGIDKKVYLEEIVNLTYPSVDSLASLLQCFGKGCHIFKKDLKRAYRQFFLDPGDIHLTGYCWNDSVFIDVALVMGSRSAAQLCQRVTNAVSYIAKNKNITILNYLDDLCAVSKPSESAENFEKITQLLSELGLLESEEKSVKPSTRVEFLGIMFDTDMQTLEVTPGRLVEVGNLINLWLTKRNRTKRQLQSLIGKLIFVSRCVFASRIFISRMLATLRGLEGQEDRFYISKEFRKDLIWWSGFLQDFNGVSYIPDMVWKDPDLIISTDACLTGSGGWCNQEYFSCKFPEKVLKKSYHINILEMLTVLVALRLWSKQCGGLRIKIYCDNLMSVGLINSGKSRDKVMLAIIREVVYICAISNIHLMAIHLPGVENRKADYLSRAPLKSDINLEEVMGPGSRLLQVKEDLFDIKERW